MHCVIEGQLWQGNAVEAEDLRAVLNLGVRAIVDLAGDEPPISYPRDILYLRYPIFDGGGNPVWLLNSIIETTVGLLTNGVPTFVYCGAGLSRSPTIVSAAVSRLQGIPPDDALRAVIGGRYCDVSPTLWNDVRRLGEC